MVDLEKIKREVKGVCQSIDNAFIALCDRSKEYEEVQNQIDARKGELLLLDERKANVIQSVRDEQNAAIEEKKQYTEEKLKYRKLRDEEKLALAEALAELQAELDSLRIREMSLLKSEQSKVISETKIFKQECDEVKTEYLEIKSLLTKLKKGIPE